MYGDMSTVRYIVLLVHVGSASVLSDQCPACSVDDTMARYSSVAVYDDDL